MADIEQSNTNSNLTILFPSAVKSEKTFEEIIDEEEDFEFSDIGSIDARGIKEENVEDLDTPIYSQNDMRRILKFAQLVRQERKSALIASIKKESTDTPPVVVKTEKEQSSPPPIKQHAITGEGKITWISKKDYCTISDGQLKILSELQFSPAGKSNYEQLESLYNIIVEIGLLTLINKQRVPPVPTSESPLGYTPPRVIYRPEPCAADMSKNQFIDHAGVFNHKTCTHLIAIAADDIVRYNTEVVLLKKIILTTFDKQMLSFVQPLLAANKILDAFHALITRVRGTKQIDIARARANLAAFTQFDMSIEIYAGMNELVRLMNEVAFATGISLTEDELKTKFHQCVFNDERINMHNCVLDSMAREYTYQQTVDNLCRVMDLLPPNKQKLNTAHMNVLEKKITADTHDISDEKCPSNYDPTTDVLYEQYINALHASSSPPAPHYSYHVN